MIAIDRVSANALATWSRGIVAVLLGFFASRWLLATVGTEGYGLWVVACGMVALASLAHGVLASATGRFLFVAAGRGDVPVWFAASVKLHFVAALATVVVGLPACLAYVRSGAVPPESVADVSIVVAVLFAKSFAVMANTPCRQLFAAHQRMVEPAVWGCADAVFNFAMLAWMVTHPGEWFVAYAAATAAVGIAVEAALCVRARRVFGPMRVFGYDSRANIMEMLRFAGWRFVSDGGWVISTQGVAVLVNGLLGPALAASAGIARTVATHCASLSESVGQAYDPAIANAVGASSSVRALVRAACVRQTCAYLLFALPLALLVDPALRLWLGKVPPYAGACVLWLLATGALDAFGRAFYSAVTAKGSVRGLYIGVGLLHGAAIPLGALVWRLAPSLGLHAVFASVFATRAASLAWTLRIYSKS